MRRYGSELGARTCKRHGERLFWRSFLRRGEAYRLGWRYAIVLMNDRGDDREGRAWLSLSQPHDLGSRLLARDAMAFDAHERAVAFFIGAGARGVYDTRKTAPSFIRDRISTGRLGRHACVRGRSGSGPRNDFDQDRIGKGALRIGQIDVARNRAGA